MSDSAEYSSAADDEDSLPDDEDSRNDSSLHFDDSSVSGSPPTTEGHDDSDMVDYSHPESTPESDPPPEPVDSHPPPPPPVSHPLTSPPPTPSSPVSTSPPNILPPPNVPSSSQGSNPTPSSPQGSNPTTAQPTTVTREKPSNSTTAQSRPVTPYHNSHSPSMTSSSNSPASGNDGNNGKKDDGNNTKAIIGGVVGSVVLIMLLAGFFVVWRRRKKAESYNPQYSPPACIPSKAGLSDPMNPSHGSQPVTPMGVNMGSRKGLGFDGGSPDSGVLGCSKFFTLEEVMEMTSAFARKNIIGEGGFGCVYKGWTPDEKVVAVKKLKAGSERGDREFKAEVEIISRIHHKHLVSLVGYSIGENQRVLIYEFVPNYTLEHHLHGGRPVLDWAKRRKVAIGSAKGLAYLHEDCHPKIIHRDIKSANILLDDAFEAQVADFGLARLNDTNQTHVSTRVMGTFGYLAPEYALSGKLTDRSDVFSFGVVLLELITGRKPVDSTQPLGDESLVEWARPRLIHAIETGDLGELVDPRLQKHYIESEMFRMTETAAACVRHSAPKRPRMVQVVRALDSEGEVSDLSNGVKYGQSAVYNSGQYDQDIENFMMANDSTDSYEFNSNSGEYTSRSIHGASGSSDCKFTSP